MKRLKLLRLLCCLMALVWLNLAVWADAPPQPPPEPAAAPTPRPARVSREVQKHGYLFEEWVHATFFDNYQLENYTQEWDVPATHNKRYGGVPVSIKFTKYGTSVDLGDALRQFHIDQDFLLIIGYWRQEGNRKRIVNLVGATVNPKLWKSLWSPITYDDLTKLDAVVKDRTLEHRRAAAEAKRLKSAPPFTGAVMTVNPKIDDKGQRRLQCSLRFDFVFERLAPKADPRPLTSPQLFGVPAPEPFLSSPRTFNRPK